MALHPLAGQPQPAEQRINVPALMAAYYRQTPDVANNPSHKVSFGTSGHRGCALNHSFNEAHILAITQAIVEYRQSQGLTGPVYIGKDTHALSEAAFISVVEVLVGNGVRVRVDKDLGFTPTPVISHAVLTHNAATDTNDLSDGIVITPSHNPPQDGGIKYNTAKGGPADVDATGQIAERANALLANNLEGVQRAETPLDSALIERFDFVDHYVGQLDQVVDMKAIAKAGIKIGVDPMGGSGLRYWKPIAKRYGLNIELINEDIDPRFAFMPLDKDGKVRMDCSSPYAMANLLKLQSQFDIAIGNDPDYDRHGIVCRHHGLMNPNAYLAVAINYLSEHRPDWKADVHIGKTLVSSAMIDRVVAAQGRTLCEVPVGFKWYVSGMFAGDLAFGGEESAGASFLRKDGTVWSTDKDGFILALLAAEILAVTGKDPAEHYDALTQKHGSPIYKRIDVPTTLEAKQRLSSMDASAITSNTLAGQPITRVLTNAPGNNAPIGGLKVETADGWFAARPSGTENLYKIYLESFVSEEHLQQLESDVTQLVDSVLNG